MIVTQMLYYVLLEHPFALLCFVLSWVCGVSSATLLYYLEVLLCSFLCNFIEVTWLYGGFNLNVACGLECGWCANGNSDARSCRWKR